MLNYKIKSDNYNQDEDENSLNTVDVLSLISCVSHELKTPLCTAVGYSELLENEVKSLESDNINMDYFEHVRDSGKHILQIINTIQYIAKVEDSSFCLNKTAIDLQALLLICKNTFINELSKKNITLSIYAPKNMIELYADENFVRLSIESQLFDIIKSTNENTELLIKVSKKTNKTITVSIVEMAQPFNNKIVALPEAYTDHSWNGIIKEYKDRALSIILAKTIVTKHEGSFDIYKNKAEGTVCTLRFPII